MTSAVPNRRYDAATAKGLCQQPFITPGGWKELMDAAKPGGDITPLLPGAVRGPDAGLTQAVRVASGLAASSTFQGLQHVVSVVPCPCLDVWNGCSVQWLSLLYGLNVCAVVLIAGLQRIQHDRQPAGGGACGKPLSIGPRHSHACAGRH